MFTQINTQINNAIYYLETKYCTKRFSNNSLNNALNNILYEYTNIEKDSIPLSIPNSILVDITKFLHRKFIDPKDIKLFQLIFNYNISPDTDIQLSDKEFLIDIFCKILVNLLMFKFNFTIKRERNFLNNMKYFGIVIKYHDLNKVELLRTLKFLKNILDDKIFTFLNKLININKKNISISRFLFHYYYIMIFYALDYVYDFTTKLELIIDGIGFNITEINIRKYVEILKKFNIKFDLYANKNIEVFSKELNDWISYKHIFIKTF